MTSSYKLKHLLSVDNLDTDHINHLLTESLKFKSSLDDGERNNSLKGKVIAQLFFEPSTRTRLAFEMAIYRLGGQVMNVDIDQSSVKKGESLKDTIQNIASLGVDGFIVRHACEGAASDVAKYVTVPVINAGDGTNEHPTQALLDIFTMTLHLGDLSDKNVLIWGDIKHSRVARSTIKLLDKVNANIFIGGPSNLMPNDIPSSIRVITDFVNEISVIDVLSVLRIQYERDEASTFPTPESFCEAFGVTNERLMHSKKELLIMHPGPANRDVEISSDILDNRCVALKQVYNGVAVRMSLLHNLFT